LVGTIHPAQENFTDSNSTTHVGNPQFVQSIPLELDWQECKRHVAAVIHPSEWHGRDSTIAILARSAHAAGSTKAHCLI